MEIMNLELNIDGLILSFEVLPFKLKKILQSFMVFWESAYWCFNFSSFMYLSYFMWFQIFNNFFDGFNTSWNPISSLCPKHSKIHIYDDDKSASSHYLVQINFYLFKYMK